MDAHLHGHDEAKALGSVIPANAGIQRG